MIAGIHISKEIFAIDVLTALKSFGDRRSMFCDCYDYMETRLKTQSMQQCVLWEHLVFLYNC